MLYSILYSIVIAISRINWFVLGLFGVSVVLFLLGFKKEGCRVGGVASFILLVVCLLLPFGKKSSAYLENYFPRLTELPQDIKGVILLGGSFDLATSAERGFPCYNEAGGRLIQGIEVAQRYPHLPLLFTGGGMRAYAGMLSESELARSVFEGLKVNLGRVLFEDQSKNTFENAVFSFKRVQPKPGDRWVLITSSVHMPRAVTMFRAVGWNVIPYPVDYKTKQDKTSYTSSLLRMSASFKAWEESLHEWRGLLDFHCRGKSQTLLPDKEIRGF